LLGAGAKINAQTDDSLSSDSTKIPESELRFDAPVTQTEQERINAAAAAQREAEVTNAFSGGGGIGFFAVFRVIAALAIVALAIYGVVYFLKSGKRKAQSGNEYLKLLASIPLTPKTAAAVISIGNKAYLTGISESQVSLLAEVSDQELIDTMLLEYARGAAARQAGINFFNIIEKYLPARIGRQATGAPQPQKTETPPSDEKAVETAGNNAAEEREDVFEPALNAERIRLYRERLKGIQ
jgi:flagellar protein FliO/FliZ